MTILTVGSTLAGKRKTVPFQQPLDLTRLQDRDSAQDLADLHRVGTDELRLEPWLAILQQERDDLLEVGQQLVDGRALGVGAGPAGDVADEKTRIGVPLDHGSEGPHGSKNTMFGSGLTSRWRLTGAPVAEEAFVCAPAQFAVRSA